MSSILEELKQKAAKLAEGERAELALALIESLDAPTSDDDVERAWEVEIERRAAQVESGDVHPVSGDAVIARLRRQLE